MTLPGPDDWPVESLPERRVGDFLRERAATTPDRVGLVDADADERWTFGEFDGDRVSARAARFEGRFDGGRVGLLLETGVGFAETAFVAARRGRSLAPFNRRVDDETLEAQAERAGLAVLVCDAGTEQRALDVAPDGVPVASLDEPHHEAVRSLVPDGGGATDPVDPPLDAERLLLFTSGTTGRPKGVRLTGRNLVASANGSADRLGVEPGDRWLVCLPTYHMGGFAPLVRSTLYGTTTVLQREFEARETARIVDEYDISCLSLVPTMLDRLLDAGWSPPERLRFVLLGGGPAPESLVERALDREVPVCPTYGTTETASQIATATPAAVAEHPGTVGRPLRDIEVSIRDENGDAVTTGETGELVVDGPTVAPGYLDDDATDAAFGDVGLRTGDLGYADEAGRLWVVGRVDDAVVTGGETVHPARVVDALRDLEWVADAAVVGLPDEEWGERVAALVVPTDGRESASADDGAVTAAVRDALRGRLPDYGLPKTVGVAAELPRTASGTVDRETVRERLLEANDE